MVAGTWTGTAQLPFPETLRRSNYLPGIGTRSIFIETLDITGDGLLDYIDASAMPWVVYPGECVDSGGQQICGFGIPISNWSAPMVNTEESQENNVQKTYKFLSDLNADGLPDYVVSGLGDTDSWQVYLNNGFGFDTVSTNFGNMGPIRRRYVGSLGSANPTETSADLIDFNGDGLPDIVTNTDEQVANPFLSTVLIPRRHYTILDSLGDVVQYIDYRDLLCDFDQICPGLIPAGGMLIDALEVHLNNGHGFDPPVYSPLPTAPDAASFFANGFVRFAQSGGDTVQDLIDVTGDGLPDLVNTENGGTTWRVLVNVGSGKLADDVIEIVSSVARSTRTMVGAAGPIRDLRSNGSLLQTEMRDWNGDGLPDRITGANGNWTLRTMEPANATAPVVRPWLLLKAEDGRGSTFEVRYAASTEFSNTGVDAVPDLPFSIWVVEATRQTDGTCTAPPAPADRFSVAENPCIASGNEAVQSYSYANGFYDTAKRQFRGFGEVTKYDVFGNKAVNTFYQDEHRKGRLRSREVRTPNDEFTVQSTTNTWLTQVSALGDGRTQVYLAESVYEARDLLSPSSPNVACKINRNKPPDGWGRITHTCSLSCTGDPGMTASGANACESPIVGQVDTITEWADPIVPDTPVRERPRRIRTEYIAEGGATTLISEKTFLYDGILSDIDDASAFGQTAFGLVKSITTVQDVSHIGAPQDIEVRTAYDQLGNAIEVRDARGVRTTIAFDQDFSLYPTDRTTFISGGGNYTTTAVHDLRYGQPLSRTDQNQQIARFEYDSLGRLICETFPGDNDANCQDVAASFTRTTEYHYIDAVPGGSYPDSLSYVEIRKKHSNSPNGYVATRKYVDALERTHFKTREQIVDGGSSMMTIVEDHTLFDMGGRAKELYTSYVAPAGVINISPPGMSTTSFSYELNGSSFTDPTGRLGETISPDGTRQTTKWLGKVVELTTARGDLNTSVSDDFGREIRRESGSSSQVLSTILFTYDGAGKILSETINDDSNTTVSHEYDSLGLRISTTDPDSGIWRYGYDANGSLVYEDSPKANVHVQMCLDDLGRIEMRCTYSDSDSFDPSACSSSCGSGQAESTYFYDDSTNGNFGIGRLTSVEDSSGSALFIYDERGGRVHEEKTILNRTATFDRTYNATGQLETITYPDGEVVTYHYRQDGLLNSVDSVDAIYVSSMEYDVYGRVTRLERGNGVVDTFDFHDETSGFRLQNISVKNLSGSVTHLDLSYFYNNIGKISQISDGRDSSGPLSNDATFGYDGMGRLTSQSGTAGSAFDASYAYDALGNISQLDDTILTYSSAAPHHIQTVDGAAVTYDANGNRASRVTLFQKNGHPLSYAAQALVA